jgi:hypothetical protein
VQSNAVWHVSYNCYLTCFLQIVIPFLGYWLRLWITPLICFRKKRWGRVWPIKKIISPGNVIRSLVHVYLGGRHCPSIIDKIYLVSVVPCAKFLLSESNNSTVLVEAFLLNLYLFKMCCFKRRVYKILALFSYFCYAPIANASEDMTPNMYHLVLKMLPTKCEKNHLYSMIRSRQSWCLGGRNRSIRHFVRS